MAQQVRKWKKVKVRERGKIKTRLVYTRKVFWYRVSQKPILLVIRRYPKGKEKDYLFFMTDVTMNPSEVIGCFADR